MSEEAKKELKSAMIEISERAYYAGWMGALEHNLWYAIENGPRGYGQTEISKEDIEHLKDLSNRAGGWWIFDNEIKDNRFLKFAEWKKYYSPEITNFRLAQVYHDIKGDEFASNNVYFIFDGECPICTHAAYALNIKMNVGDLVLINARKQKDHPLLAIIKAKNLDLDAGMVIVHDGQYYHGKTALKFMAKHGAPKNAFNLFIKSLFWSDTLGHILYPWMRGTRNWLLRRKDVGRIDNLNLKDQPIFKSIFGEDWDKLPPVMHKHYAIRPYSDDIITVKGELDVMCRGPVRLFSPLFRLMRNVPPVNEESVPVIVHFSADKNRPTFHFHRTFYFKEHKPYSFRTAMIQIRGNEVVEMMAFGLCWRMNYLWEDGRVILRHKGYAFRAFGHFIPLPITWLIGRGDAWERAIDENKFEMSATITHPLWGKVYEYKGWFDVK